MPAGRDIVLLYGPPWRGPARFSKHHLASYFARQGDRVLYVEAPLGPLTLLKRRAAALPELASTLRPPHPVEPHLWLRRYFNPLPYHAAFRATSHPLANRLGQRLLAPLLRRDLRRLGFHEPIVVAGLPHAVDLLPGLPRRGLVYHCSDDFAHVQGFPRTLPVLELSLCEQADFVVATAETLADARRPWNPNTYWIPNGADVEHFSLPASPATDVPHGRQPVIGFVGALAQWVDVSLLATLARQRPAWQIVLVGPLSTDVMALRAFRNVHLLGPRPYTHVPRYLAAMDVALIPFVQDPVTWYADPIKAYEYLAAGLPVVATDLPALHRLRPHVRLAATPDQFVEQVEAALAEGRQAHRAERQSEAARHSWDARFAFFDDLLREHLGA